VGQERLGPSYFFILLVLGPLNSLLWYVPSSRYTWGSAPILFLHEQIKDIIIVTNALHTSPKVAGSGIEVQSLTFEIRKREKGDTVFPFKKEIRNI
jgi:hypothetical protein